MEHWLVGGTALLILLAMLVGLLMFGAGREHSCRVDRGGEAPGRRL